MTLLKSKPLSSAPSLSRSPWFTDSKNAWASCKWLTAEDRSSWNSHTVARFEVAIAISFSAWSVSMIAAFFSIDFCNAMEASKFFWAAIESPFSACITPILFKSKPTRGCWDPNNFLAVSKVFFQKSTALLARLQARCPSPKPIAIMIPCKGLLSWSASSLTNSWNASLIRSRACSGLSSWINKMASFNNISMRWDDFSVVTSSDKRMFCKAFW